MKNRLKNLFKNYFDIVLPVFIYGLFFLCASPSILFSQTNYNIIFDKNFTPIATAEDFVTFHKLIHTVESKFFPAIPLDENKWYRKTTGIFYRASKTFLLDFPFDYTLFLLQHEVFGHGARFRQFDYQKNSFNITLPPPYGKGSGFAQIGQWKYQNNGSNRSISYHELSGIYSGGVEANTILAKRITNKWLNENQQIDASDCFFYFLNLHSITSYILKTKETNNYLNSSNDILYYLYFLNSQKGYLPKEKFPIQLSDLKQYTVFYGIDPFQYFAAFAYLKYLWSGNEKTKIPMLPIGKIKYLPSFHLGLTPFGPNLNFENYFVLNDKIISLQYSYGIKSFYPFWNQKIELINLINKKYFSYSPSVNIWQQPSLELGGKSLIQTKGGNGGAIYNTFVLKTATNSLPVNIFFQLMYKTTGYLEGEKFDKGITGRGGFNFSF